MNGNSPLWERGLSHHKSVSHLLRSLGLDVALGGSKEEQQPRDFDNFASLCTLGLAPQERDVVWLHRLHSLPVTGNF